MNGGAGPAATGLGLPLSRNSASVSFHAEAHK